MDLMAVSNIHSVSPSLASNTTACQRVSVACTTAKGCVVIMPSPRRILQNVNVVAVSQLMLSLQQPQLQ
ncbi:uncharacterized protein G2W53_016265 [Senna tora]|uniref:Uncharacterized protein n=1 Tax=Senna tora TaxID=362788 RepID=A0A834TQ78_9FABA|nr:uncharacterized protein G2W53_016265 [Senna tora]